MEGLFTFQLGVLGFSRINKPLVEDINARFQEGTRIKVLGIPGSVPNFEGKIWVSRGRFRDWGQLQKVDILNRGGIFSAGKVYFLLNYGSLASIHSFFGFWIHLKTPIKTFDAGYYW